MHRGYFFDMNEAGNIKLFNIDCMIKMAEYPDKYFDLAIVISKYCIIFV